jgi:hypothetical protein
VFQLGDALAPGGGHTGPLAIVDFGLADPAARVADRQDREVLTVLPRPSRTSSWMERQGARPAGADSR